MFLIKQFLRSGELDWEGTNPSHGVVFDRKAALCHLYGVPTCDMKIINSAMMHLEFRICCRREFGEMDSRNDHETNLVLWEISLSGSGALTWATSASPANFESHIAIPALSHCRKLRPSLGYWILIITDSN